MPQKQKSFIEIIELDLDGSKDESSTFETSHQPNIEVINLIQDDEMTIVQDNILEKIKVQATSVKYQEIMMKFRENWKKKEEIIQQIRQKEALKDNSIELQKKIRKEMMIERQKEQMKKVNGLINSRIPKPINIQPQTQIHEDPSKSSRSEMKGNVDPRQNMNEALNKQRINHNERLFYDILLNGRYFNGRNNNSNGQTCSFVFNEKVKVQQIKKSQVLSGMRLQQVGRDSDSSGIMKVSQRLNKAKYRYLIPSCCQIISFLASKTAKFPKSKTAVVSSDPPIPLNSKMHKVYAYYHRKKFSQRIINID